MSGTVGSMALTLSRRVARFNRAVNNPIQSQYAWLLPPWVVVCHRGRRSGALYRTPVNGYRRGSTLAIVVLYGEQSDWVRNVLAGPAQIVRAGRTHELRNPRLVDPRLADPLTEPLPGPARVLGRLSGRVLVGEMAPPSGRFGRGPRA
jgi:deazaflavin-dependent oxidoreductase (nitroreductase family)